MHARELLELSALVTLHGPLFAEARASAPVGAIERYWAASKCRIDRWNRALRPWAAGGTLSAASQPTSWKRARAAIEEILVSELLTRTWTAAAAAYDRGHGGNDLEPIALAVMQSHQQARRQALQLMIAAPGIAVTEAVELNHLRRRLERWCDLLLAYLSNYADVSELVFERDRVEDFAADLPAPSGASGGLAWQLMFASMRASFGAHGAIQTPNGDLNRSIAASILSCLHEELFDSTGLVKSLWVERIARVADDTQGMLDTLVLLDLGHETALPPRSLGPWQ